ncbi:hypothetical protein EJB05_13984, partial [Eragrostis curvula]
MYRTESVSRSTPAIAATYFTYHHDFELWDPVTDQQSALPASNGFTNWNATMLCAAGTAAGAYDHLHCRQLTTRSSIGGLAPCAWPSELQPELAMPTPFVRSTRSLPLPVPSLIAITIPFVLGCSICIKKSMILSVSI